MAKNRLRRKILAGAGIGLLAILVIAKKTSDPAPFSELERTSINQVEKNTESAVKLYICGELNLVRRKIDGALEEYEKASPRAREQMEEDVENSLYFAMRSCVREGNQEKLDFYKEKAREYGIKVKGKDLEIVK